MTDTLSASELDTPYALSPEQIAQFRADGFIKLKEVYTAAQLETYGQAISRVTLENNNYAGVALEERDTYGKAFIQVGNLWMKDDVCKTFAFGKRLARIATELLGSVGVRMYHDQALFKEARGGFTPWHADQQYWPLSTAMSVTAWIPLQAVPVHMGAMSFARGSHAKNVGREIEISDESERLIQSEVQKHGLIEVCEPYDLGEVSFHYGWTLHRTGPNDTDLPRNTHTIIFMDQDMILGAPKNPNQQNDWDAWSPSTKVGEIMADELNPVLYSTRD